MAEELKPGVFRARLSVVGAEGVARAKVALTKTAQVIEGQAKVNASTGSHKYGTPTPAWKGGGPSVISGDLRRSITHTPVVAAARGWECRVGPASIPHGSNASRGGSRGKGTKGSTTCGKIGEALETKMDYPFLEPAFRWGVRQAPMVFRETFSGPWRIR